MLNIFKRLVPALVVAMFAIAAIAQFPGGLEARAAEEQASGTGAAGAADIHKQQLDSYYEEVKTIFRGSARLLGRAQGLAQRKPLIELQNHCSRSLGKLRAILNSYAVKSPAQKAALPAQARGPYSGCIAAKADYDKKPGAMTP